MSETDRPQFKTAEEKAAQRAAFEDECRKVVARRTLLEEHLRNGVEYGCASTIAVAEKVVVPKEDLAKKHQTVEDVISGRADQEITRILKQEKERLKSGLDERGGELIAFGFGSSEAQQKEKLLLDAKLSSIETNLKIEANRMLREHSSEFLLSNIESLLRLEAARFGIGRLIVNDLLQAALSRRYATEQEQKLDAEVAKKMLEEQGEKEREVLEAKEAQRQEAYDRAWKKQFGDYAK